MWTKPFRKEKGWVNEQSSFTPKTNSFIAPYTFVHIFLYKRIFVLHIPMAWCNYISPCKFAYQPCILKLKFLQHRSKFRFVLNDYNFSVQLVHMIIRPPVTKVSFIRLMVLLLQAHLELFLFS